MADGGRQFIEPGAGYLLKLQAVEAFQRTGCRVGMLGRFRTRLTNPRSEIHQAPAQAKQYGGKTGSGKGQGFGAGHGNVLEITWSLPALDDSSVTGK